MSVQTDPAICLLVCCLPLVLVPGLALCRAQSKRGGFARQLGECSVCADIAVT